MLQCSNGETFLARYNLEILACGCQRSDFSSETVRLGAMQCAGLFCWILRRASAWAVCLLHITAYGGEFIARRRKVAEVGCGLALVSKGMPMDTSVRVRTCVELCRAASTLYSMW